MDREAHDCFWVDGSSQASRDSTLGVVTPGLFPGKDELIGHKLFIWRYLEYMYSVFNNLPGYMAVTYSF